MSDFETVKANTEQIMAQERKSFEATTPHVKAACEAAQAYSEQHPGDSINVAYSSTYHCGHIHLFAKDMRTSLALRRLLTRAGYRLQGDPCTNSHGHHYTYNLPEDSVSGIELSVFPFASDDAICRRVKVGTQEVPVYEIVCDGETSVAAEDGEAMDDL